MTVRRIIYLLLILQRFAFNDGVDIVDILLHCGQNPPLQYAAGHVASSEEWFGAIFVTDFIFQGKSGNPLFILLAMNHCFI
jgi:hypothetical protein